MVLDIIILRGIKKGAKLNKEKTIKFYNMAVIQIGKDLNVRIFYNLVYCKHRGDCSYQEEREAKLKEKYPSTDGRCYFNPSIFQCEKYQELNPQERGPKHYDLRFL